MHENIVSFIVAVDYDILFAILLGLFVFGVWPIKRELKVSTLHNMALQIYLKEIILPSAGL